MTTTTNTQLTKASVTAITGANMNALANAAYAMGPTIDNRPTVGSVSADDLGYLEIVLASAVTPAAGAPNITVYVIPAPDGTNFPSPPGTTAGAAPVYFAQSFPMVASVSSSRFVCPNLILPPFIFEIMIQQNLGVAFPATGNTALLYRATTGSF